MSHEIDMSNNRANMAYVGEVPWHGLGHKLKEGATIEQWQKAAGLNWTALRSPVRYDGGDKDYLEFEGKSVLYRDDTLKPLSVVSEGYKIVQPKQILEFYRSLVKGSSFTIETAGCLYGGKKIWALARGSQKGSVLVKADKIRPYVLLATSYDGSLATTGQLTTIRVVCNNTMQAAMGEGGVDRIKVPHSTKFDEDWMKRQLGLADEAFSTFLLDAKKMAKKKVKKEKAIEFFLELFNKEDEDVELEGPGARNVERLVQIYTDAPGQDLPSAKGTAWGLVNAVTRFADFEARSRSTDNRLNSAWFGTNKVLKQKAWDQAKILVAA